MAWWSVLVKKIHQTEIFSLLSAAWFFFFFWMCNAIAKKKKAQNLTLNLWEMLRKTNQLHSLLTLANELLPNPWESKEAPLNKVTALGSHCLLVLYKDVFEGIWQYSWSWGQCPKSVRNCLAFSLAMKHTVNLLSSKMILVSFAGVVHFPVLNYLKKAV